MREMEGLQEIVGFFGFFSGNKVVVQSFFSLDSERSRGSSDTHCIRKHGKVELRRSLHTVDAGLTERTQVIYES